MKVDFLDDYEGQATCRISTEAAIYYYHLEGCGFASIIDPDGYDWISFHPHGGSDGVYRGIPNMIHPAGGFHPGATTGNTEVMEGDDHVLLSSTAFDRRWQCQWRIDEQMAMMQLTAIDGPHWFLYEGTAGGETKGGYDEESTYVVTACGRRRPCNRRWATHLTQRSIAFANQNRRHALALIDHTVRPQDTVDSFWSMEQNMTVFGFGRTLEHDSGRWSHLETCPACFTVAMIPDNGDVELQASLVNLLEAGKESSKDLQDISTCF